MTEDRIGYLIKRVQQALRNAMDAALAEQKLTTSQHAVLTALQELGGSSNAELARRAFVTPQTMIRILANLERAKLIHRAEHPEHGRILVNALTAKGRRVLKVSSDTVDVVEAKMLSGLSIGERNTMVDLLKRCGVALGT